MSLYSYIHEYDSYDAVMLAAHNAMKECALSSFEYEQAEDLAMKKVMFENADYDVFMEEAKENIFVRIGKAIASLVKKVTDFIKGIFDKTLNREKNKEREKNVAIAKKYLSQHPEQRDEIIASLEKGDIELKDVAQYARDIESVIKLAERQDTEADTINNKVNDVCDKIDKAPAIRVAQTLGTIGAALGGVFVIYKSLGQATTMVTDVTNQVKNSKIINQHGAALNGEIANFTSGSAGGSTQDRAAQRARIEHRTQTIEDARRANALVNGFSKIIGKIIPEVRRAQNTLNTVDTGIASYVERCARDDYEDKNKRKTSSTTSSSSSSSQTTYTHYNRVY